MNPPSTEGEIRHLAASLGAYIYVLVGVLALLETGAGIGLHRPGEIAVVLGGVSAGQSEIALLPLIAVVWACALTGDLISFTLGQRLGQRFLLAHGPKLGISRQRIEQAERFYAAHGGKTLILGRFIGFVRPLSPFIAGASKMPVPGGSCPARRSPLGSGPSTFSVLGYIFSQSLDEVISITERGTLALTRRRRRRRSSRSRSISRAALGGRARPPRHGAPAAAEGE